jgi:vitamin B12 transporter
VTEAATDTRLYNPARTAVPLTFDGRGRTRRVEYQGSYAISPDWTATFGLDSERASMNTRSPSPFAPNPVPSSAKVTLNGLYGQIEGQPLETLTVTAGLRRDDHEVFADHTLGQVSAVWSLNQGRTLVRAGFGQGFKAPTLYQLYSPYGNLGLAPESAEGLELGLEQTLAEDRLTLTAAAFRRQTENQIDFVSCSFVSSDPLCRVSGVGRFGYYDNIARTLAQGIELSVTAGLESLTVEANYTLTDTENDSAASPNRGKDLPRRARHQANLSASYGFQSGALVSASLRYSGKAWDNAANTLVLKAYSLLDLRASVPLDEHFEIYGRVENLLDRNWETTRGYGAPGRAAYLGLRARF